MCVDGSRMSYCLPGTWLSIEVIALAAAPIDSIAVYVFQPFDKLIGIGPFEVWDRASRIALFPDTSSHSAPLPHASDTLHRCHVHHTVHCCLTQSTLLPFIYNAPLAHARSMSTQGTPKLSSAPI